MLRYVMTRGEMVLDNVRLTLNEIKEWSRPVRGSDTRKADEIQNVTFAVSQKIIMRLYTKTVHTGYKISGECITGIVHVYIKIPQQDYVERECTEIGKGLSQFVTYTNTKMGYLKIQS